MISTSQINEDLDTARQLIYTVNLDSVLSRLVKIENWSQKDAIAAVQQYRNYLFLRKKYPSFNLPPSIDIDDAWHAHVLHTKEYREFCREVFHNEEDGYLDHDPHLGREGSAERLAQLFEKTQTLYHQEFGEFIYPIREGTWFARFLDRLREGITTKFPKLTQLTSESK